MPADVARAVGGHEHAGIRFVMAPRRVRWHHTSVLVPQGGLLRNITATRNLPQRRGPQVGRPWAQRHCGRVSLSLPLAPAAAAERYVIWPHGRPPAAGLASDHEDGAVGGITSEQLHQLVSMPRREGFGIGPGQGRAK